mmetsp:Transcript_1715/g.5007  ORF Transcript_1715/g.5007 Transcript_1715/m.5007 type:complete len:243 (-) Transcript_1715:106-834(-)
MASSSSSEDWDDATSSSPFMPSISLTAVSAMFSISATTAPTLASNFSTMPLWDPDLGGFSSVVSSPIPVSSASSSLLGVLGSLGSEGAFSDLMKSSSTIEVSSTMTSSSPLGSLSDFSDLTDTSSTMEVSSTMASSSLLGSFSGLPDSSSAMMSFSVMMSAAPLVMARLSPVMASSPVVPVFVWRRRCRWPARRPRRLSRASATSLLAARRAKARVNAAVEYFIVLVAIWLGWMGYGSCTCC